MSVKKKAILAQPNFYRTQLLFTDQNSFLDICSAAAYYSMTTPRVAKLILVRHGESTWNKENRFTGWTDVPLSERVRYFPTRNTALLLHELIF